MPLRRPVIIHTARAYAIDETDKAAGKVVGVGDDGETYVLVARLSADDLGVTVAELVDGKIPIDQLPALDAVAKIQVADQAAMLASAADPLTLAVREDDGSVWLLSAGGDPTVLGDWVNLSSGAGVTTIAATGTAALSSSPTAGAIAIPVDAGSGVPSMRTLGTTGNKAYPGTTGATLRSDFDAHAANGAIHGGGGGGGGASVHADLSSVTPDQHHNEVHPIDGATHTLVGARANRDVILAVSGTEVGKGSAPVPAANYSLVAGATITTASLPAATAEGSAIQIGAAFEIPFDPTYAYEARLMVYVSTQLAGAFVKPKVWNGSAWVDLADTAGALNLSVGAAGRVQAGFVDVAAAVRGISADTAIVGLFAYGNTTGSGATFALRQVHLLTRS